MSERDFDFDLIMGLAAGDFPPDEAAEIEAGLDADARRELASQRAALQSLGLLRQPALAAAERRKLRAGVRAELGIAEAAEAGGRTRRRKVRWARAFPALAAAAALVVVIGVARNDGREPTPEATATHAAAAATTAAAAPAVPPEQSRESATMTQDAAATTTRAMPTTTTQTTAAMQAAALEAAEASAAEEALLEESAAAQAADSPPLTAATTAVGAGAGGASPASFDLSLEGLLELGDDEELLASFLDEYTAGAAPFPVSELGARAGRAGLVCWEAAGAAEAGRVLFAGAGLIDGSEGEAYIIEEDGAAGVRLFNAPDCTNLNP